MTGIRSAIQRPALSRTGWGQLLIVLLTSGVVVAVVNFVKAYHNRSTSDALVAAVIWLGLYPLLVFAGQKYRRGT